MNINTALWVIQIILGIKMLNVSYSHGLRQSQPTIQEAMQKMGKFSQPFLYIISVCTLMGTMGLILPGVLGSSTWIIPVTAALLSVMLLFSIFSISSFAKNPKFLLVSFFSHLLYLSPMGGGWFL
ncbi:MAG: DoxX family protein [Anaerolineales bacterium]